jgi:hypothetical protein
LKTVVPHCENGESRDVQTRRIENVPYLKEGSEERGIVLYVRGHHVSGSDEARLLCGQYGNCGTQGRFGLFAMVKAADVLTVK